MQGALAVLSRGPCEGGQRRHFEAHLAFDDFTQGDIGRAESPGFGYQRPASAAAARVQLADATGNQVNEGLGIGDPGQSFLHEESIHKLVTKSGKSTVRADSSAFSLGVQAARRQYFETSTPMLLNY